MTPQSQQDVDGLVLDALAAIAASERGDIEAVRLLLGTLGPAELGPFLIATVGYAGRILRIASQTAGIGSAKIVGAMAQSIRDGTG